MTKSVFVDSFAWIAAINKSDNYHNVTLRIIADLLGKNSKLFTTNYVIIETINALSKKEYRNTVVEFIHPEGSLCSLMNETLLPLGHDGGGKDSAGLHEW